LHVLRANGRYVQILEKRCCAKCGVYTNQVCFNIKYEAKNSDPSVLIKKTVWVCPTCNIQTEETKEVPSINDRAKIIQRILRLHEDYPIESMNITSDPKRLLVEIEI